MRVFLTICLLVASQPLLIGIGVLTKWAPACGGGACTGTVEATFSPRDALLTALAAAAPYLLAVLVAAVTMPLTSRGPAHAAAAPEPVRQTPRLSSATQPEGFAIADDAGGRLPVLP